LLLIKKKKNSDELYLTGYNIVLTKKETTGSAVVIYLFLF